MKVVLKKQKKLKIRKPPKHLYRVMSSRLMKIGVGHIYPINKSYFRRSTHMEIRQYLKRIYEGEFVLIDETPKEYIVKRVKNETGENEGKKVYDRRGRFYIPKRKVRNGKVDGE